MPRVQKPSHADMVIMFAPSALYLGFDPRSD